MQRIATTILSLFLALFPASAGAQERNGLILPTTRQLARTLNTAAMPASVRLAQAQPGSNDSLKNGAIIGLIVGAASMAAFAAILVSTDEACGCKDDIVRFAAIGGAIGAGVGAGLDALLVRRSLPAIPRARIAIRF
jgi:hypothetical protein